MGGALARSATCDRRESAGRVQCDDVTRSGEGSVADRWRGEGPAAPGQRAAKRRPAPPSPPRARAGGSRRRPDEHAKHAESGRASAEQTSRAFCGMFAEAWRSVGGFSPARRIAACCGRPPRNARQKNLSRRGPRFFSRRSRGKKKGKRVRFCGLRAGCERSEQTAAKPWLFGVVVRRTTRPQAPQGRWSRLRREGNVAHAIPPSRRDKTGPAVQAESPGWCG